MKSLRGRGLRILNLNVGLTHAGGSCEWSPRKAGAGTTSLALGTRRNTTLDITVGTLLSVLSSTRLADIIHTPGHVSRRELGRTRA